MKNPSRADQAWYRQRIAVMVARQDAVLRRFLDIQEVSEAASQAYLKGTDSQVELKQLIKQAEELLVILQEKGILPTDSYQ